jgi:hypothetical protein
MTKSSTMSKCTSVPPVLMLEMMRRHNTTNTAQCRVSRASLEATGRCHQASTHVVLPWRTTGSPCRKIDEKAPYLSAVSLALAVCRYNTKRIAQLRVSRAIAEATGRRHWASIAANKVLRSSQCCNLAWFLRCVLREWREVGQDEPIIK